MKELRIRPQIADNDLKTLVKRIQKWFLKKERVKIIVGFRARQHLFMDDLGPKTINRFLDLLETYKVVNSIQKQGTRFVAVIDP